MSHAATNWAIQQRGLKPATKLVLWYLCDRHNPDLGCFPSQERLAEDAEMSVSSLNDHLAILEAAGLIRRIRRSDPKTKKQLSTLYLLGCDPQFTQEPTPNSGDGFDLEPTPNFEESRLRNSESNPVSEPLSEKKKSASASDFSQAGWARLLQIAGYPALTKVPSWWRGASALAHVAGWGERFGLTEDEIIAVAAKEREGRDEPLRGPKGLDEAMARYALAKATQTAPKSASEAPGRALNDEEALIVAAAWINGEKPLFGGGPSPSTVRRCIAAGLVTPERAKERGLC